MESPYLRSTAAQPVPDMPHANPSQSFASLFNSRSVPTLWTFLMIPGPLAEPDYPPQASFFTSLVHFEIVPLSRRTPPLPFLPSTQFSQDIFRTEPRVFTYLLQKEAKGKSINVYLKVIQNPAQTFLELVLLLEFY